MENYKSEVKLYSELLDIPQRYQKMRIAVHLHIFYPDLVPEFIAFLGNIPIAFDMFISVPESVSVDKQELRTQFKALANVSSVVIERIPNCGRDIAPMICTFGKELMRYDVLLHLQTKKSPHDPNKEGWRRYILEHLLGSKDLVGSILTALSFGVGAVTPPDFLFNIPPDGWSHPNNIQEAQKIVNRCGMGLNLQIDCPSIDFPQGSMIWARVDYIKEMFNTGLLYTDFPPEPIPVDGTIAHALERMFFLWGANTSMKAVKLYLSYSELAFSNYARHIYLDYANALKEKEKQLKKMEANRIRNQHWFCAIACLGIVLTVLLVMLVAL